MIRRLAAALAVVGASLLAGSSPALAQGKPSLAPEENAAPPKPEKLVEVEVHRPHHLDRGEKGSVRVVLEIRSGWHVNANPPSVDYLVPTSVKLELPDGLVAGRPLYPPGKKERLAFADEPLLVYEKKIAIEVPIQASAKAAAGRRVVTGTVRFQACNDQLCLAPASLPFTTEIEIEGKSAGRPTDELPPAPESPAGAARGDGVSGGDAGTTRNRTERAVTDSKAPSGDRARATGSTTASPFATPPSDPRGEGVGSLGTPGSVAASGPATSLAVSNPMARLFEEHGLLAFLSVFLLGLGLNLTPCVYPMLSVTLALFGARQEQRLGARLPAAIVYMLGIALTYSVLGLVAAFTGTLFGSVLQMPGVLLGIAVVLVAMSLSMFGLFEIQVPSSLLTKLGSRGATGLVGVFLSGLMVGLFAAPCVGPPIVALLAVVAQSGNPWFGFASFFVLSLGLGLPYLVLATYSGLLQRLPRSGTWMVWIKKLFGVLLLAVALFYLALVIRPQWSGWVAPAAMIVGGIYLGFLEPSVRRGGRAAWLQRAVGAVAAIAGAWLVLATPARGLEWGSFAPQRLDEARAAERPVILDFYADWCVPCHELERSTFSHPEVMRLASRFTTLKVNLTRFDSGESQSLRERFRVEGVPTVVFLGPDGTEIPGTRVVGFVGPVEFAAATRRALSATGLAARTGS